MKPPKAVQVQDAEIVRRLCCGVVVAPDTGRWHWQGYTDAKGYGQIKANGRACWAHRIAYAAFTGPLADGMHVDHVCCNPSCVNPAHLEAVTNQENTRRRDARRREAQAAQNESEEIPI